MNSSSDEIGTVLVIPVEPPRISPNAAYQPRRALRAVGCMRLFGGALTAAVSRAIRSARNTFKSD
jgi:hypothetical protein